MRAPYQTLTILYKKENKQIKFAIFYRNSHPIWQFVSGGGEDNETPIDTVVREIKEETNLDIKEENLELIAIVSGNSRRNEYPNGDVVINNTALYCVRNYSGNLKWDSESKSMKFFDLDNLPTNQNDPDLIEIYKKYLNGKTL